MYYCETIHTYFTETTEKEPFLWKTVATESHCYRVTDTKGTQFTGVFTKLPYSLRTQGDKTDLGAAKKRLFSCRRPFFPVLSRMMVVQQPRYCHD